ncbi:hypothetical protein CLOM_g21442 [Closterium sp. NIES-68]|nr:hypothetical protein CLOM_g21442 [Closterium sp. NIES-68]
MQPLLSDPPHAAEKPRAASDHAAAAAAPYCASGGGACGVRRSAILEPSALEHPFVLPRTVAPSPGAAFGGRLTAAAGLPAAEAASAKATTSPTLPRERPVAACTSGNKFAVPRRNVSSSSTPSRSSSSSNSTLQWAPVTFTLAMTPHASSNSSHRMTAIGATTPAAPTMLTPVRSGTLPAGAPAVSASPPPAAAAAAALRRRIPQGALPDDGYCWLKYGEKRLARSGNSKIRSYFKCASSMPRTTPEESPVSAAATGTAAAGAAGAGAAAAGEAAAAAASESGTSDPGTPASSTPASGTPGSGRSAVMDAAGQEPPAIPPPEVSTGVSSTPSSGSGGKSRPITLSSGAARGRGSGGNSQVGGAVPAEKTAGAVASVSAAVVVAMGAVRTAEVAGSASARAISSRAQRKSRWTGNSTLKAVAARAQSRLK